MTYQVQVDGKVGDCIIRDRSTFKNKKLAELALARRREWFPGCDYRLVVLTPKSA